MSLPFSWSATIFAHNEAATIVNCLDSVLSQEAAHSAQIFVLVNGSQDTTESLVNEYSAVHPNVTLVTLAIADKANAWNHYIHRLSPDVPIHFFIDGDMLVMPNSFAALYRVLSTSSEARAAGALPTTGRDRTGWSTRMMVLGRLPGGLYALKGDFVAELRERGVRIPVGLIGEDFFLSCLVKNQLTTRGLVQPSPRLIFAADAGFAFRPLSLVRPQDWLIYARRLVRYQVREHQLMMLLHYLETQPHEGLPPDVVMLYHRSAQLPRYRWRGRVTPFDMLAVRQIRRAARKS